MDETKLHELADQVAEILDKKNETANGVVYAAGEVALIGGVIYVGIKLAQNVKLRRELRKYRKV